MAKESERIQVIRSDDVPELVIDPGQEVSRRLVTTRRQGSESISFHLTTYTAGYSVDVEGDGVHEVTMFCVSGSTTVTTGDGRTLEVTPGAALYMPRDFEYRHTVGPNGMVMAVACNPPKE